MTDLLTTISAGSWNHLFKRFQEQMRNLFDPSIQNAMRQLAQPSSGLSALRPPSGLPALQEQMHLGEDHARGCQRRRIRGQHARHRVLCRSNVHPLVGSNRSDGSHASGQN
jgi:hypothetical protein